MANTDSALDEYFKKYIKNLNTGAGLKSFSGFIDSLGENVAEYKPSRAVKERRINLSAARGTGYADYLKDKLGKQKATAKGSTKLAKDYLAYVDKAVKDRAALENKVKGEIVSAQLLDEREAYAYAISRGLNESEARAVTDASYTALYTKIAAKIFDLAVKYELDGDEAEYLALEYGMKKSDAQGLKTKVTNLHSRTSNNAGADAVANDAAPPTQTDLFLKGYIYEKLKRKQG